MGEPIVQVLLTGFNKVTSESESDGNLYHAACTVTLEVFAVIDDAVKMLVDCCSPWQKDALLEALSGCKYGISASDITHLVCTHSHIDHIGNLNLFPNAKIYLDVDVANNADLYSTVQYPLQLTDRITVQQTVGHTDHDLSVVVLKDSKTYVIAGDVFESGCDQADPSLWQSNSRYPEKQLISREKILDMADYIIPGHGPMFHVDK